MKFVRVLALPLLLLPLCLSAAAVQAADDVKLEQFEGKPQGLSDKVLPLLDETGYRVTGPDGVICEIWLAKEVAKKPDFQPTLFVKYPFTVGQFMGAIRLPTKGAAIDFRGQELPTGTYTLRYGHQPQDGNHLGTSDVLDFLLACSPEVDTDPAAVPSVQELFARSAKAAGSTHPAIFLLVPAPEKPFEKPALKHDSDKDLWILNVNVNAKAGDQKSVQPLQIVVSGQSEG